MNILCVIDSLGAGGAQRQIVELALGFRQSGHQVHFLTYRHSPFFIPTLEAAGITVTCFDAPGYLKRLFTMRRWIRRGNFDAVLSFLEAANFIAEFSGLPFRKWKLVVGERSANQQITKSPRLIFYRLFHLFADVVVANSEANLKLIRKANPLLRKSKCRVIYNIIDFEHWIPGNTSRETTDGHLSLVCVASHQYLKNLAGLVRAVSQLNPDERKRISVDWYGDMLREPYHDQSIVEGREMIRNLKLDGLIRFHDPVKDILGKIQQADVIGLFSFYEGFPNIVCEAMSCAKPVLCSAISDLPRILAHEREMMFDPSDTESIVAAIRYTMKRPHEELSAAGRKNREIALRLFDKQQNVSQYLKLFES